MRSYVKAIGVAENVVQQFDLVQAAPLSTPGSREDLSKVVRNTDDEQFEGEQASLYRMVVTRLNYPLA